MGFIDFILNIAGLLLWLSWRSFPFDPLTGAVPSTLSGTVRRAAPVRLKCWHFLAALGGLIFVRAVFYWKIGGAVNWTARINLIATSIPFQSDFFQKMFLYSVLSFLLTLALFYLWLLLFVIINRDADDLFQKLARQTFGKSSRWPTSVLLLLPIAIGVLVWPMLSPLLVRVNVIPSSSFVHRVEQGALLGLGLVLTWKFLIVMILGLHLINSYIYFGDHPFWKFINLTAWRIMSPLRKLPLEIGKVDFTPLLMITLVFFVGHVVEDGISTSKWVVLPGLSDFYRRLTH